MGGLIIEDDENKLKQIKDFLQSKFPTLDLITKRSYQSGLKEIVRGHFDLIVLDMSMPTFDVTPDSSGGRFRTYAGKDIMEEMIRLNILSKVIIVTQFDIFGEGESYITLSEMSMQLKESYPSIYLGTVYYNASEANWKQDLEKLF